MCAVGPVPASGRGGVELREARGRAVGEDEAKWSGGAERPGREETARAWGKPGDACGRREPLPGRGGDLDADAAGGGAATERERSGRRREVERAAADGDGADGAVEADFDRRAVRHAQPAVANVRRRGDELDLDGLRPPAQPADVARAADDRFGEEPGACDDRHGRAEDVVAELDRDLVAPRVVQGDADDLPGEGRDVHRREAVRLGGDRRARPGEARGGERRHDHDRRLR